MKIKPKKNPKTEAWNEYVETCRIANALRDKTVKEALEKYLSVSKVSSAATSEEPDHQ